MQTGESKNYQFSPTAGSSIFYLKFQVLSVNVSVFTLSAIAVDRYRAVLHPLSARVSKRKATWAILSIWAVGFILALPTELDYK